jgi:hypothetical protein
VRARVDRDLFARIQARAQVRSQTISEYLRELIVADLEEPPRGPTLAITAQTALVSAFFLRKILNGLIGDAEAERYEVAATAQARKILDGGEGML